MEQPLSEPSLRPLAPWPAMLMAGRVPTMVIADLHLGLGFPTPRSPIPAEGTAAGLAETTLVAARAARARAVLLVGDVKHPIRGTPRHVRAEVREYFERLEAAGLRAEVVLGNHDVGLPRMLPPAVAVHPSGGLLRGRVGFFHGHAWPSDRLLRRAQVLVAGHLHPGFRLAPSADRSATGKERCWVRCELPPPTPSECKRPRARPWPRASSLVVLPAFNPLCASVALNREEPGRGRRFLFARFLIRGTCRAFLLDGTDLGVLPRPLPGPRPGA